MTRDGREEVDGRVEEEATIEEVEIPVRWTVTEAGGEITGGIVGTKRRGGGAEVETADAAETHGLGAGGGMIGGEARNAESEKMVGVDGIWCRER